MLYFIEFLRAIATALITNSHFKGVYPIDVFSFGGGLGLALFFMISGYLLTNIRTETKFIRWYPRKILRMYIPLWIFRAVLELTKYGEVKSAGDFIKVFIYPTYWFVASMVIFYAVYFCFLKYVYARYGNSAIYVFSSMLIAVFVILYVTKAPIGTYSMDEWKSHDFSLETPYFIMQFVWILCMVIGLWIKRNRQTKEKKINLPVYLILTICSVLIFMVGKLLIARGMMLWMRILLPVSYIGFAYCLFIIFMNYEKFFSRISESVLGKFIKLLSMCSLEIYYVQFVWIAIFKDMAFPLNWLMLCAVIISSAYILHRISEFFLRLGRTRK